MGLSLLSVSPLLFLQARVEANASIVALLMLRKSLVSLLMPLLVDLIGAFKSGPTWSQICTVYINKKENNLITWIEYGPLSFPYVKDTINDCKFVNGKF
jgi:hypothetical protein